MAANDGSDGSPVEHPTLSETQSQDSDEVGYLFLQDGEAKLVESASHQLPPTRTWIDVEWRKTAVSHSRTVHSKPTSSADSSLSNGNSDDDDVCSRCDLVLRPSSSDTTNKLVLKNPPLFNGTLADMSASCACPCTKRTENRSDAALLAGVAFTCQFYGYIQIRRIQVMFHDECARENDDTTKMSLVITFAMPALTNGKQQHAGGGRRSIIPSSPNSNTTARKKTASNKPLPPSAQLLLTISRSDWEYLDKQMNKLEQQPQTIETRPSFVYQMRHDGSLKKSKRTMFPPKFSLEELYLRLRGVGTSELCANDETTSPSLLTSLPQDVVITSIAPFLRARSLDALRRSCKLFHYALRSTVPGLKLRLYTHQVRSLEWMRRRESQELSEEDVLDNGSKHFGTECVRGDMHRAVTGGATTCLRLRGGSGEAIRIDQQTGFEIPCDSGAAKGKSALSRRIARGGLLCDDPGLGKTITVMSLILQTAGLSTMEEPQDGSSARPDTALSHTDEDIFQAYWKEHVPYPYRRGGYMTCLNALRRHYSEARMFEYPVDPERDCCPDYHDVIDSPICLGEIETFIDEDYGFQTFEADVDRVFKNATSYNPAGHQVHEAALKLSKAFITSTEQFKAKQVLMAKKSFSRVSAKPNSSVAALLEKRRREELLGSLTPTSGNLLIVPGTLLNHWEEQLKTHVDWTYVTDKIPLIYHYDGSRARDEEVETLCRNDKTHAPLVFIDRAGTKPLPSADFLAMFRCVLTTTQRLTNEWKNGSYEEELKQDNGRKKYTTDFYEVGGPGSESASACSLLKVLWFRLIVDEGHSMGRGSRNSAILFASWIQAQRRWAMTGTPTPQTASSSGLTNLRGLMSFLQHDFFSPRLDGDKTWQGSIVRSWNSGSVSAFFRLHSLMALLMVRHTKLDIDELPPPKFGTTLLEMSSDEIASYNVLVSGIMSNLKITSMEGLTSGRQDSLLYPSQSRNAREGFTNVRLVCSGRHGLFPTIKDQAREELIAMLKALGFQGVKLKLVENFLHRVVTEQLSSCNVCGMQLHTLLLIPCGHLVCVDCFDNSVASCAVCNESFDVDTFQRLQPGIELQWHSPEEIVMKKAAQATAMGTDATEGDSDQLQVIDIADRVALQPAPARRRTRRPRDGHVCEYDVASSEGKCTLCLEEHFDCVLLNKSRCEVCYKRTKACPDYESKSFYLSNKLQELRSKNVACLASSPMTETRPLKAIVFSEFRSTLNLVGDALIGQFGGGCVAEYWGKSRDDELVKFAKSPNCFIMLLGRTGSEGLDLSFVTHIFTLEKTWDKSLENQTISRAWRMGAKGHVEVETLVARHSAEETMMEMEATRSSFSPSASLTAPSTSDTSWQGNESVSTKEYQRARLLFLLKNLKLIRSQPQSDGQHTTAPKKRRRAAVSVAVTASTSNAPEEPRKKAARVRFQA